MKVYGDEECIFHLYFYEDLLTSKVLYPQRKILILIDISREDEHPEIHIYFFFINFDQIKIIYKGNKKMSYIHKKELTKQICARAYIYIYIERERERERDSFIGLDDVILTHIPPYPTVYGHN